MSFKSAESDSVWKYGYATKTATRRITLFANLVSKFDNFLLNQGGCIELQQMEKESQGGKWLRLTQVHQVQPLKRVCVFIY